MAKFVSEKELEDEKTKRQEEWDKVRSAEDPVVAPEPEADRRPLWAKLKEQTEKKEAEMAEAQRLKTMVRGLDDEEVGFLDMVDSVRVAEERRKLEEERALLQEYKQAVKVAPVVGPSIVQSTIFPPGEGSFKTKSAHLNKQASLLSGIVKRKSSDDTGAPSSKRTRPDDDVVDSERVETPSVSGAPTCADASRDNAQIADGASSAVSSCDRGASSAIIIKSTQPTAISLAGARPSAMRVAGVIPGLNGYVSDNGGSDNSESDSDSSSDGDDICSMAPVLGVKLRHQDADGGASGGGRQSTGGSGGGKAKSSQVSG